jgi:hypothetical protein
LSKIRYHFDFLNLSQFWINWKKIKTAWGPIVSLTIRTLAPRPHQRRPNHGHCCCLPPAVLPPHCGFPRPRAPPSRSPISSASSTPRASLSRSPLRAPHRTPLSSEHHHVDRPLRPSPEATFAATTSAQAHCRSPTSEPATSATPPACHRWCPSTRMCYRGRPIPGELLHPPLLSSIHRVHSTLLTPPPHPSSLRRSTGRSSEPPPCLCSARPDTIHW